VYVWFVSVVNRRVPGLCFGRSYLGLGGFFKEDTMLESINNFLESFWELLTDIMEEVEDG